MPNKEFPAINWLGYSMDMSRTTPMDISAATNAVQTVRRIVSFDTDTNLRPVEIDGETYDVPKAIGVATDEDGNSGSYITFANGNDASTAFRNDSSLGLRYFAVTGDPSVGAATEKIFRRNNQYAFFSFNQNRYLANLRDFIDLLNADSLNSGIRQLPTPFNGENAETLKKYKDFFQRFGTHVVTKVRYGARMQLNIWASNANTNVNPVWSSDVNAEFGGIPSGGVFDPSIQSQAQYKAFRELMQKLISVQGGDQALATSITIDPSKYAVFENWTKTVSTRTSLLGLVTTELWSLMKDSSNEELNKNAGTIQEAFEYIVSHPQVYKTAISLDVQSDWAEFGLLTPSAIILPGTTTPTNTQLSETKVTWGKEQSHDYHRETINFFVVNDGYPIDFYISHGSSGSQPTNGNARVTIEGQTFINDHIIDNNWNTMWFYQAGVTGSPQKFISHAPRRGDDKHRIWDNVLEQYLHEVEGY